MNISRISYTKAYNLISSNQIEYLRRLQFLKNKITYFAERFYSRDQNEKSKTIKDVIDGLVTKIGIPKSRLEFSDRSFLIDILPKEQSELPPRRMKDSWDCAVIPLGSDIELRERYITFVGGVRTGRLLEDMDVFAVWLCYKHLLNPRQKAGSPSPYSVVTALVDRIDFEKGSTLQADKDIILEGNVTWVGRSSLETTLLIKQQIDGVWKQVTRAVFVMVARDPLNQSSVIVNPLICETGEEKRIFQQGEVNKLSRKLIQQESLFNAPPNETEKGLVHDLFLTMASKDDLDFAPKNKPENSLWIADAKLKNLIICHPEQSNRFQKIFGGFIMRQAFELSWASAFVTSKQRPQILHVDDIMFRKPVEIGSLLYLNSNVIYTRGKHLQISTKANVVDPVKNSSELSNIFHFTFGVDHEVAQVLPRTYNDAMLYLDGRRHYQLVRGLRKFYSQGENKNDQKI